MSVLCGVCNTINQCDIVGDRLAGLFALGNIGNKKGDSGHDDLIAFYNSIMQKLVTSAANVVGPEMRSVPSGISA
jgi:hypothetical protein